MKPLKNSLLNAVIWILVIVSTCILLTVLLNFISLMLSHFIAEAVYFSDKIIPFTDNSVLLY